MEKRFVLKYYTRLMGRGFCIVGNSVDVYWVGGLESLFVPYLEAGVGPRAKKFRFKRGIKESRCKEVKARGKRRDK